MPEMYKYKTFRLTDSLGSAKFIHTVNIGGQGTPGTNLYLWDMDGNPDFVARGQFIGGFKADVPMCYVLDIALSFGIGWLQEGPITSYITITYLEE